MGKLARSDELAECDVNLEALNRYVLVVVGLVGMALYIVMVSAGVSELLSRLPKPKKSRKRSTRSRVRG